MSRIQSDTEIKVCQLYKAGKSSYQVAKDTGVSATQVRRILTKNNISGRDNKIDPELERKILEGYLSGKKVKELEDEFKVSEDTVRRVVKRNGEKLRYDSRRIHKIDENYFETIDTEGKAYFLGLLMADGYLNKKNKMIRITLHEKDVDILEKFAKEIYTENSESKVIDNEGFKTILIMSVKMHSDLCKLGCIPAKTFKLQYPEIRKDLVRHFVRGYFDGDGCAYVNKKWTRAKMMLTGAASSIEQMKNLITENAGIIPTIYGINRFIKDGKVVLSDLTVGKQEDILKFIDWLYIDSNFYIQRKFKRSNDVKSCVEKLIAKTKESIK